MKLLRRKPVRARRAVRVAAKAAVRSAAETCWPATLREPFRTSLKPGQAKLIPKGADIIFQLHYTTDGKTGSDKSRVGIIFSKEKPTTRVFSWPR